MQLEQELQRLDDPRIQWRSLAGRVFGIAKGVVVGGALLAVMTQCGSLVALSESLASLEQKNTYVQVGSDQEVMLGKPVTEEENLNEFITTSLSLLYTVSAYAPKDFDPDCTHNKPCQEALSKGVEVKGVGNVPPVASVASYVLSEDYQKPFLRSLVKLKPKNYDRGASLLYRPTAIGKAKDIGNGELEIYVTGGTFAFDAKNNPLLGVRDDKIVTVRPILKIKQQDMPTQLHKTVNATRERGWEITQIVSVENEEGSI